MARGHQELLAIAEVDLTGRTILITGTTSGIGTETARALALKGAHVIMANRNIVLAEALKNRILEEKVKSSFLAMRPSISKNAFNDCL
ncbi:hypothetical protein TELCIR_07681 [Teladorsagia circumcincta]|uniref:Oxidoreductase, short chain dehydrogenase/reductase family protein n=1 Tax=Teladorsagia circumcincta TaxID=45464 RepID=A0A2G9UJM9_TELCI|nr:hypothetical protein TELCIR_07681 [Teladorsagia circumcincta]